jgi:hypothetical protein
MSCVAGCYGASAKVHKLRVAQLVHQLIPERIDLPQGNVATSEHLMMVVVTWCRRGQSWLKPATQLRTSCSGKSCRVAR